MIDQLWLIIYPSYHYYTLITMLFFIIPQFFPLFLILIIFSVLSSECLWVYSNEINLILFHWLFLQKACSILWLHLSLIFLFLFLLKKISFFFENIIISLQTFYLILFVLPHLIQHFLNIFHSITAEIRKSIFIYQHPPLISVFNYYISLPQFPSQ